MPARSKTFLVVSALVLAAVSLWALLTALSPAPQANLTNPQSLDGPYAPTVYSLAADPANPDVICAGTWGDGLYCSQDGGQNWNAGVSDADTEARKVKALARAAGGNKPIYAGTWQGAFRSDDDGQSWKSVSLGPAWIPMGGHNPLQVNSVLLGDAAGNTVYAGTRGGVLKSTDGGASWSQKNQGLSPAAQDIQALIQDQAGVLYAATTRDGVYRSQDGGDHWVSTTLAAQGVFTVACIVGSPDGVVYAGSLGRGVYKSADGGQTWQEWNEGIPDNPSARRIQALAIDAKGALYAGTVEHGVYKLESGTRWQPKNKGWESRPFSILSIVAAGQGTVYIGTFSSGVYVSRDGGESWEERNDGIPSGAFEVQALATAGDQPQLYAGTNGGGVYVRDGQGNWRQYNLGLPFGMERGILALDASETVTPVLYAGTWRGLYRRRLEGQSPWEWVASVPTAEVTALAHRGSALYAGLAGPQGGVYQSRDNGLTWTRTAQGLPQASFNRVSIKLGTENTIYAVLLGHGIYESADGGYTWKPLPASPRYVWRLDLSQRSWWHQALAGGARQVLYAQAWDGVYSRRVGGSQPVTLTLVLPAASASLADPYHPGVAFASLQVTGTQDISGQAHLPMSNLMISLDDGQEWKLARRVDNLVTALALDPTDPTRLYIGTANRGVYQARVTVPAMWQYPVTAARLWCLISLVLLLLDLLLVSGEFRVPPWEMFLAIVTRPGALYRLFDARRPLPPLQQLILAFWPERQARPAHIQQALEQKDISTSWSQLTSALETLEQYRLVHKLSDGAYRIARAVTAIARQRFVLDAGNLARLAKAVQEESHLHRDAQQFFEQAGMPAYPVEAGLLLFPRRAETDQAFYAGMFARPITRADIDLLLERARVKYHDRVENRQAFAVVAAPPQLDAYQRIAELATQPPHFQVLTISHLAIRQALTWGTAAAEVTRSLARAGRDVDLYALEGPAVDPLDFFGRQDLLHSLEQSLNQQKVIRLRGLPRIGKTSLLWQLKERLGSRPCVYLDLSLVAEQAGELLKALDAALSTEARAWRFEWRLADSAAPFAPDEAAELGHMLASYRDAMHSRLPQPRLLLLLDTATTGQKVPWPALAEIAQREPYLSAVVALADRTGDSQVNAQPVDVPLFSLHESSELAEALLRPLGRRYEPAALRRLYTETGGHPQLLRQLCSQIAGQGQAGSQAIDASQVSQAAQAYLRRQPYPLRQIWKFLNSTEQDILLALRNGQGLAWRASLAPEEQGALDELARLGLVRQAAENYEIAAALLRAWLEANF